MECYFLLIRIVLLHDFTFPTIISPGTRSCMNLLKERASDVFITSSSFRNLYQLIKNSFDVFFLNPLLKGDDMAPLRSRLREDPRVVFG